MSTATFTPIAVDDDAWTEVAVGSAAADVFIQAAGKSAIAVAVKTSLPNIASDDYFVLWNDGDSSVLIHLATADIAYARSLSGKSLVRGYTVSVA